MNITFDPREDLEDVNAALLGFGLAVTPFVAEDEDVEEEIPEPKADKPKRTRSKPKKAKEKPEPEEEDDEDEEEDEEDEEDEEVEVGLEDLQELAAEILANLGRPVLAAALKKLKAKSLSAMDPEDYAKAHKYLQSIVDGED